MWIPIRRLALKLPTILQVDEDLAVLFYEGGTFLFLHPNDLQSCAGLGFTNSNPSKI